MNGMLSRMKGDSFAIMYPRFYILVVVGTFVLSTINKGRYFRWDKLIIIVKNWNDYWPLYVLAVFLAYLLGNFLRAIPVRHADKLCKWMFSWTIRRKGSLVKIYYTTDFPYHAALIRLLKNLQKNGFPEEVFSVPLEETVHTAFNFFKSVLCSEAPNAFAYTQTLEARVRLFAGMFWSACFGILTCLLLACFSMIGRSIEWTAFHTGLYFHH